MNTILLVEDEENLRHIVASYLKKEHFTVIEASNGYEAMERFFEHDFCLLILDLMLPGINGFEVCSRVRSQSDVPILILTARDGEADELRGFHAGADEYITKPFSPEILIARIKSLLKRCDVTPDTDITMSELTISLRQRTVYYQGNRLMLTPKEFDLLYYLVNNKNIALSREQMLDAVWGMDYYGDTRTVDTHIKCIRAKLGEFGSKIKTIRKFGYKLEI